MSKAETSAGVLTGMVTRAELRAELARCTDRTILRYERQGLPVFRRGRLRLYDVEAVRAWLRGERRVRSGRAAQHGGTP